MATGRSRYIDPDQLCVGVFVELEIGWLEHPFPLNRFRIKNEAQLKAVRELGLRRIRVNPTLSTAVPLPSSSNPDNTEVDLETLAETAPAVEEAPVEPVRHELDTVKLQRLKKMHERHEAIDACERNFRAAAKAVSSINSNLFSRSEASLEHSRQLVNGMVSAALANRDITLTLMNNKMSTGEVYDHGMNVLVLGLVVGQQMGLQGDDMRRLGLACMFHDLGKTEIAQSIVNKQTPLTPYEQKILNSHVQVGVETGVRLGIEPAVLKIISQHHERADGSGFPRQLTEDAIVMTAKIICVVNDFDNLCNPVNSLNALTPHEALKHMYARKLKEYSPLVISQFIRSMGIYPAGTLVELSNGFQGLVMSVNTERPLRPTVMIYDDAVPRRDAIILDLNEEPDLSIERAIKRSALTESAANYLNPRNRIAYFTQDQ